MKNNFFIILAILLLSFFSLAQAGKAPSHLVPINAPECKGTLDIRIHPPENELHPSGHLLLVDPQGRKSGKDLRANKLYTEIPYSSYESENIDDAETGAAGPETRILYIGKLPDGEYTLYVIGTKSSTYDMEIRGYDCEMNHSHMDFLDIGITKDEAHTYKIKYSNKQERKIAVIRSQ
ncbi:MAG: hypothetical protein ACMUIP_10915 [bacterium]